MGITILHEFDAKIRIYFDITNFFPFFFPFFQLPSSPTKQCSSVLSKQNGALLWDASWFGVVKYVVLNGINLTLFCAKKQKRNGKHKKEMDAEDVHPGVQVGSSELLLHA
ncbi:MAG: hypothetical protein IKH01_11000, partial [Prevotella sp.]|nr:hypothetical protein [Prevotella sp.]